MCKVSSASIAADGQAVSAALLSISTALATTNPTVAADLSTAAKTLVAATSGWKTGDPVDDINTAATAIESILAVIPATAPYATFVAIAVAALDILIANLGTQSTQTPTNTVANALQVRTAVRALPDNPFRGLVQIHRHVGQSYRGALVDTWNEQVDAQPELAFPKL